jgi:hypothetical protein
MKEICPECGNEEILTTEHIIPQWIIRLLPNLGFNHTDVLKYSGLTNPQTMSQLCFKCNVSRGGKLSYHNKVVAKYLTAVVLMIELEINKPKLPVKVLVKCCCKENEQIKKWEDRQKITQEIIKIHNHD